MNRLVMLFHALHRRQLRPERIGAVVAVMAVVLAVAAGSARAAESPPAQAERRFTAMTYNLYLGADLTPLFGKSGAALVQEAAVVYAHVVQTDFPSRAQTIARQIAAKSPDVVGLQEVALWQTGPVANPEQMQPTYDFLGILLGTLDDLGHPYRVAAVDVNFSGALPISATTLASFTDRDAIIVRMDVPTSELKISNPTAHNFQAGLPVTLAGQTFQVPRGWSTVDVKLRGKSYRFANTHLEAYSSQVRDLQARELAASLAGSPYPVVLVGDLNSLPTDSTGAYGILGAAGFVDGWVEAMDGAPGFTSGQTDDLSNVPSQINHRIDYVLHNADGTLDAVAGSGDVVGEELADRTLSGLWPSDHAGVALTLHIARP